ncbi:hypothetical protein GCM10010967_23430 [Dyadobacter beijingensis]|uniref:Colicin import membrane protein n=1 Tax=Dyadobacter beijingensis TaxID=365489 RepID=A0ABQ2HU18_9BACT|nr:hypothetical protein [Dyadobacter beijingensis]GGM89856.1 hypothetical protein GCM10010967_23430 [Dyadobacter beijingensis]
MKTNKIIAGLSLILLAFPLTAQVVSKDSLATLKEQRQMLEIGKRLNENKTELAKLENEREGKVAAVSQTSENAQKAADANKQAADKLGEESQDRKLARRANNSAGSAKSDAKKARKAGYSLEKLDNDINSLKASIQEDEKKLTDMQPAVHPEPM